MDVPETLRRALEDRYAIERELGAGGMATVYLAEDLRHHRKVALKVLRPEIAVTVGAGRFAREIEVAARLQHPNILPLLDSGEADGLFFYVMPYVEGESLRDRLARGGELPVQDAVRILMEVADALSHAHAHGVVHRDIKPDNVMLSGRHALVADFGVAKAVTEATGQRLLTSTGVALGTPTYMAPEQATADPHQDHRVDIYALGVLGYELLTGRAPFSATTAQEMLAAHVTATPDPVEKYRSTVSPALAAVVMKCLAKKPADRWQTADEVLQQLEPLATPSGGVTPTQTAPVEAAKARRRSRVIAAAGGVLVLAALAALAWEVLRARPLVVTATDFKQITSEPGVEFQPALSPDGQEVAYVAGPITLPRLYVRSAVDVGGGAVRLGDTAAAYSEWVPSWSPDGSLVRFWGCRERTCCDCAWKQSGKLGGAVRPLPVLPRARRPAWSADGSRIAFVVDPDTIYTASALGGDVRRVVVHAGAAYDLHSLAWSPDGKRIAYVQWNALWRSVANLAASRIWVVDAAGGTPRLISDTSLNMSPAWLDDEHLLYVTDREGSRGVVVVEIGSDGRRGVPRAISGIADPHSISYSAASRRLAFARFTVRENIWAYPLGRAAPLSIREGRPVTTGTLLAESHDVSPDGRWIVFSVLRSSVDWSIYKMPLPGGQAVPLLTGATWGEMPRWSPDGREIAFDGGLELVANRIMVVPADGGAAVPLTGGPSGSFFPVWSPSGREIVFAGGTGPHVLSRDSVGGAWRPAEPFPVPEDCRGGRPDDWAPDGSEALCAVGKNLVAFTLRGREVWRRDLAATAGLTVAGPARYSRDGRTIFLFAQRLDGTRRGVWAVPVGGGAPRPVVTFDDPAVLPLTWSLSVGPNNLYITVAEYASDIWVADLRW